MRLLRELSRRKLRTTLTISGIRARSMGFVFQSLNLVPTLTAEENVALAAEYAGVPGRTARLAARDALGSVGLADRASHRPMELSGGEQQRVAIARALVNNPAIIFGDEPTGNLDSARAREVLGVLREFNRQRGQTVLLVTHDAEVGATCDRIIRMRDGLIVGDERVASVTWPAGADLRAPQPGHLPEHAVALGGQVTDPALGQPLTVAS